MTATMILMLAVMEVILREVALAEPVFDVVAQAIGQLTVTREQLSMADG